MKMSDEPPEKEDDIETELSDLQKEEIEMYEYAVKLYKKFIMSVPDNLAGKHGILELVNILDEIVFQGGEPEDYIILEE